MDNLLEVLKFIWSKGWIAALVVVLLLLIHDPDRAEKIKELVFLPVFRLFKRGSRQYMAAKVGYTATQFVKKELLALLPSATNVKIQVRWVKDPEDPILTSDGSLIVCMRETTDQTRNILAATQSALPRIVCPTLRPCIQEDLGDAVDLALLKKLAGALGTHAKPVFQKYFLKAADGNERLQHMFSDLVELDGHGTFVAIFLEELDALGERLYAASDTADRTESITAFLEFLLVEARRELHQEITLDYFSDDFSVGIIILAASHKIEQEGVSPYLNRINQKLRQACDSIYVIAYEQAGHFMDKLLHVLEPDERLTLAKVARPQVHSTVTHRRERWKIAQLKRNTLLSDTDFMDRVSANELAPGTNVEGRVIDVSSSQAFIEVKGLSAVIQKSECGWGTVRDCQDVLAAGERKQFLLLAVDEGSARLVLSLRPPDQDPWKLAEVPLVGQRVEVNVVWCDTNFYYCRTSTNLEILLPKDEISWTEHISPSDTSLVGEQLDLVIVEKEDTTRLLRGSVRQKVDDPWPEIHRTLPKGTRFRASVTEITPNFVRVSLPNGLQGIVPKEALYAAGHEFADYETTFQVGQGLDVVVTRVFIGHRKRIRCDLARNVDVTPEHTQQDKSSVRAGARR